MNIVTILVVLCSAGLVSLLVVNVINMREANVKRRKQQLQLLKFRFDAMEELASTVDLLAGDDQAGLQIYSEALQILDNMERLDKQAPWISALRQSADSQLQRFRTKGGQTVFRYCGDEAEIKKSKNALSEAARIVKQQLVRKQIPVDKGEELISQFRWSALLVEVVTWVGLGLQARQKGNAKEAYKRYKQAHSVLLKSNLKDQRRQQCLQEVAELMDGSRDLLSPDLMPEATTLVYQLEANSSH